MTCIVAFKTLEGNSVIAGDFMASNGHHFRKVATSKVFLKSQKCAIGYTSSFRMGQILEHYWSLPSRVEGQDLDSYINVDIIESLRATFTAYGYGIKNSNGTTIEDIGGTFILLYEDRIYEIQGNYSALDYDSEVIAVGSGMDAALGSLFSLLPVTNAGVEELLVKVFTSVNKVTASVSPEFSFLILGEDECDDITSV